jgi:hypothetical protein
MVTERDALKESLARARQWAEVMKKTSTEIEEETVEATKAPEERPSPPESPSPK